MIVNTDRATILGKGHVFMKTLGERVDRLLKDRGVDLGCNTSYGTLPCRFCGQENERRDRVDTEFDYLGSTKEVNGKEVESFCIRCWFMSLLQR